MLMPVNVLISTFLLFHSILNYVIRNFFAVFSVAATPSVEVGKKRPMTIGPPEEGGSQRKKKKGKHHRYHQHFY